MTLNRGNEDVIHSNGVSYSKGHVLDQNQQYSPQPRESNDVGPTIDSKWLNNDFYSYVPPVVANTKHAPSSNDTKDIFIALAKNKYHAVSPIIDVLQSKKKRHVFENFLQSLSLKSGLMGDLGLKLSDILDEILANKPIGAINTKQDAYALHEFIESKKNDILGFPDSFFLSFNGVGTSDIDQIKNTLYNAMLDLSGVTMDYIAQGHRIIETTTSFKKHTRELLDS